MSKVKTSSNINIYYEQHGKGPDLVLISGLSADHNAWLTVLDVLAQKYRVTIFDNRGAGQTDAPEGPYSIEMLAQDTVSLMDALSISSAHIVGHSMGGMILQQICVDYPNKVNKAVLNASTSVVPPHSMAHIMSVLKLWEANVPVDALMESVMPWLYADSFYNIPGKIAEVIMMRINNPYPQSLEGFRSQASACAAKHLPDRISAIKQPTLIIAGAEDILLPLHCSEHLSKAILGSKLEVIANCGHMIQFEQADTFCDVVTSFL